MSNTFAIPNPKGGVGRTTTAVKLTSIFVHLDYRGMLVGNIHLDMFDWFLQICVYSLRKV